MNALIIGASGLVGSALVRTAPQSVRVVGTTYTQRVDGLVPLDARNPTAVLELIEALSPSVVFMPAASPNVDYCEAHPVITRAINVDAVFHAAEACRTFGALLVYFSSDYVFDGLAGPYVEDDEPSPICEYGKQKLQAEQAVINILPERHLIVRTTGVFGPERLRKNFMYRVVRTLKERQELLVPQDQYGNPTLADDLGRSIWELIRQEARGVFHVAGTEWMSRLQFAEVIAQAFGLDTSYLRGVNTSELGQVAPRPLQAGLKMAKLASIACVPDGAHQALERCRRGGVDV